MKAFDVYAPDGAFLGTVRPDPLGPTWIATRAGFPLGARFCEPGEARDWLAGGWSAVRLNDSKIGT
jgi:hypothetical protein